MAPPPYFITPMSMATSLNKSHVLERRAFCQSLYRHSATALFDLSRVSLSEKFEFPALAGNLTQSTTFLANQLYEIECLIEDVSAERLIPLSLTSDQSHPGQEPPFKRRLTRHYVKTLPGCIAASQHLSKFYRYSPSIEAFQNALHTTGIIKPCVSIQTAESENGVEYPFSISVEQYNRLLETLQHLCCNSAFRRQISERGREANRCFRLYRDYFASMFKACDRGLILRLDLGYDEPLQDPNRVPMLVKDFDHLLANRRTHQLFTHRLGFIARLSYTPELGYYWRTVFFFDGQRRTGIHHADLSQSLGLYWSELSRPDCQRGRFISYNKLKPLPRNDRPASKIPQFGPLMPGDFKLRRAFENDVIAQFCMASEFFRLRELPKKIPKQIRKIRKGGPLKPPKSSI